MNMCADEHSIGTNTIRYCNISVAPWSVCVGVWVCGWVCVKVNAARTRKLVISAAGQMCSLQNKRAVKTLNEEKTGDNNNASELNRRKNLLKEERVLECQHTRIDGHALCVCDTCVCALCVKDLVLYHLLR